MLNLWIEYFSGLSHEYFYCFLQASFYYTFQISNILNATKNYLTKEYVQRSSYFTIGRVHIIIYDLTLLN